MGRVRGIVQDFEEEDEDEEEEFDCTNSNPNAYALYMSCMNGDEGACEALEMLCGGEEEEEELRRRRRNGLGVKVKIWTLFSMLFLQLL